jgi:MptA/FolE2 family GTP cyclohydrolase
VILEDVQNQRDERGIDIDEVGVSGLSYPISVLDRERSKQDTIGSITMSVSLAAQQRGSHLSRFVEVLDEHAGEISPRSLPRLLREMQDRLGTRRASARIAFPYFLRRHAPVTGASALIDYACAFSAVAIDDDVELLMSARVPVTSVCPCSKAVSDYGAHNQRGYVTVEVAPERGTDGEFVSIWVEDLIETAEAAASSPVFPVLKRQDERHVTMLAYDNPVFVEDIVRGVAERLREDPRVARFSVEALNDESIHNHAAFARLGSPHKGEYGGEAW